MSGPAVRLPWSAFLFAALLLAGVPANAQSEAPDPDDLELADALADDFNRTGPEEGEEDLRIGPRRPWTLQVRAPVDWRSNLGRREDGSRLQGLTLAPDVSVSRRWRLGSLRIFTEVGAFQATVLPDASRDSAGFYGTFEAEAGNSSARFTPYIGYEPVRLYSGVFSRPVVTVHDISLGVRRDYGATFLDLYGRRQEASTDQLERWSAGLTLSHTLPLGGRAVLNLRGEAEVRYFDSRDDEQRRDLRTRFRARVILPIDSAVDVQLTADLQRNSSNFAGLTSTNLIIGPTLVARLGF